MIWRVQFKCSTFDLSGLSCGFEVQDGRLHRFMVQAHSSVLRLLSQNNELQRAVLREMRSHNHSTVTTQDGVTCQMSKEQEVCQTQAAVLCCCLL